MEKDDPQPAPSPVEKDAPGMIAARLSPDEVIGGRYRIVDVLGEGGMGVVYRAEHMHMHKLFALKVLHREMLAMPEVVARFEREAVLAGSINHPNVAAATDFGKLPDGSFFLILELVLGKNLRDLIADGPVEARRALTIMRGMTAGVAAAHAKGIVHRDLKPENVMLVERDGVSDFVKVLDFGIAKGEAMPESRESAGQPLTRIGSIMGTPQYMSPEQAVGEPTDARSDLYALGVIFYELLTGAAPFQGDPLQVLRQHLTADVPPIPEALVAGVPVPLASILKRLLAKEPSARLQTAAELLAALDATTPVAPVVVEEQANAPSAEVVPVLPAKQEAVAAADADDTSTRPRAIAIGAAALGFVVLAVVMATILSARPGANAKADTEASASQASGLVAPPPSEIASAAASEEPPEVAEESPSSASPSASSPAAAAQGRATRGRRGRSDAPRSGPAPRRTGPGGIYIPPPRDWFK